MFKGERYTDGSAIYEVLYVENSSPVVGAKPGVYFAPVDGQVKREAVRFLTEAAFEQAFTLVKRFYKRKSDGRIFQLVQSKDCNIALYSNVSGTIYVTFDDLAGSFTPYELPKVGDYVTDFTGIWRVSKVQGNLFVLEDTQTVTQADIITRFKTIDTSRLLSFLREI